MKEKYINQLSENEKSILLDGGTEPPFSGEYNDFHLDGVYVCKSCDSQLFESVSKFQSGCGWPSSDDVIESAVFKRRDFSLGRIRTADSITSSKEGQPQPDWNLETDSNNCESQDLQTYTPSK
jgi:peptide methionine sulfoxide reductase MsrB